MIRYSVVEGSGPLLAVDFSIFRGHSGQQTGHWRPVAAAKFEAWLCVSKIKRKAIWRRIIFKRSKISAEHVLYFSLQVDIYACGMPVLSLFTAVDAYILLWIILLNSYNDNSLATYCRYMWTRLLRLIKEFKAFAVRAL